LYSTLIKFIRVYNNTVVVVQLDIIEYYSLRKKTVDEAVLKTLKEENLEDLETPKGGKRIRGVLTILVCEALGGKVEDALPGAVAVELAHAASLDLDDIIDFDILRRGGLTEWARKGITKAVLGSHELVSTSLDIIIKHYGSTYVDLIIDTYRRMLRGELKELLGGSLYEAVIASKTASLYAVAASLGAVAARKEEARNTAYYYGLNTGMAFQIADDIVDVIKIINDLDLKRLKEPSVLLFIGYLGVETLLRNPLQFIVHGAKFVADMVKQIALNKLTDYVKRAEAYASQIPAVSVEYTQLLQAYPNLSVDLMFKEGGLS